MALCAGGVKVLLITRRYNKNFIVVWTAQFGRRNVMFQTRSA